MPKKQLWIVPSNICYLPRSASSFAANKLFFHRSWSSLWLMVLVSKYPIRHFQSPANLIWSSSTLSERHSPWLLFLHVLLYLRMVCLLFLLEMTPLIQPSSSFRFWVSIGLKAGDTTERFVRCRCGWIGFLELVLVRFGDRLALVGLCFLGLELRLSLAVGLVWQQLYFCLQDWDNVPRLQQSYLLHWCILLTIAFLQFCYR